MAIKTISLLILFNSIETKILTLVIFMGCSCDNRILHGPRKVHKLGTVACNPNEEVLVILWILLALAQDFCRDGIELHMEGAKGKEGLNHGP